jgi:hypothetical protein
LPEKASFLAKLTGLLELFVDDESVLADVATDPPVPTTELPLT